MALNSSSVEEQVALKSPKFRALNEPGEDFGSEKSPNLVFKEGAK